jgi:hypothetical protein
MWWSSLLNCFGPWLYTRRKPLACRKGGKQEHARGLYVEPLEQRYLLTGTLVVLQDFPAGQANGPSISGWAGDVPPLSVPVVLGSVRNDIVRPNR